MKTIFISYSAEDKEIVRALSGHLGEVGAKVWLAEEQLMPGDSIADEISKAIDASDAVLFLISGSTSKNRWLSSEMATAIAHRKRVIPLVLDKNAEVPILLQDRFYLDLSHQPDFGVVANKIMQSLSRPFDEERAIALRKERVLAEREQLERKKQQLALLKENNEVEIRSEIFSLMLIAIYIAVAFLFYLLGQKLGGFHFLWLPIAISVGALIVRIHDYFRRNIKHRDRDVKQ